MEKLHEATRILASAISNAKKSVGNREWANDKLNWVEAERLVAEYERVEARLKNSDLEKVEKTARIISQIKYITSYEKTLFDFKKKLSEMTGKEEL